ncbi:cbb3-type cytochrome c oxidase subunit I [Priestia koreensis]|uniref:cbb3-type cytochrome c oxidase subunit I n=1 Tax=Priestia koreensis TaxID=284581 RepID=UPI001F58D5D7|nr:cbb3-type cytochrome c oxidase subunit I [Priestia koreensis]UNL85906.1 cytochrome-c oxidase [Priestia koreensis]
MGIRMIKISAVYFAIGMILGYYMSIVHQYALTPVHVHINLLGWTSLTLAGLLYHLFPDISRNMLTKIHVWLHNIGLPIMMIGLTLTLLLNTQTFIPVVAAGATLVAIGVLVFVYNVVKNLK